MRQGWPRSVHPGSLASAGTATPVSTGSATLDAATGKTVWDREVFRQVPRKKETRNSYSTPTPVTDGKRVYAVFSDGGFAALDFAGNIAEFLTAEEIQKLYEPSPSKDKIILQYNPRVKRYDLSDQIRDGLAAAGIEVRDTPAGQEWNLLEG